MLRSARTVGRVDAREARPARARALAVAERELDRAAVHEVELLLALVQVPAGRVARRDDDGVDAERGDAELLAHLAEAGPLAHAVEAADRPAVARGRLASCAAILGRCRRPTPPLDALLEPLRRDPERSAVLLDVDGVLAPIVAQPDDAHMPETTRRPLIEIARRYGTVACVSGRRASDARRIVSLGSIAYLGNHGSEVLRPGAIAPELDRELQAWTRRIQGFMREAYGEELKRLRVRLEDKEAIAALHWRGVPDEEGAEAAIREVAERAEASGYKTHWGRKVLEIRPPVRIDKGAGIVGLLRDTDLAAAHVRRRRHGPTSTRSAGSTNSSRWGGWAPRCGSACARTRARRSSRRRRTPWSRAPTGSATCSRPCWPDGPVRFVDFLKATVLLSAGSATLLAALTVARVAASDDYGPMEVAVGWWLVAALIGGWLGRRNAASPPIARLLADARVQMMLPELRPGLTLLNRLWPLLFSTLGAAFLGVFMPQVSAVAAGFAIIWALAWRRQEAAVSAIEERDGFRFYIDKTPPLSPIRLIRTPGLMAG